MRKGKLFGEDALPIEMCISPEQLVTDYISRLIQYPGALQVVDFADGRVQLVGVKATTAARWSARNCARCVEHIPSVDTRVAAIYQHRRPIIPEGDTVIEAEDEVFFVAAKKDIPQVISELRKLDRPVKRVLLAGGGNIGLRLARALEDHCQVEPLEHNRSVRGIFPNSSRAVLFSSATPPTRSC